MFKINNIFSLRCNASMAGNATDHSSSDFYARNEVFEYQNVMQNPHVKQPFFWLTERRSLIQRLRVSYNMKIEFHGGHFQVAHFLNYSFWRSLSSCLRTKKFEQTVPELMSQYCIATGCRILATVVKICLLRISLYEKRILLRALLKVRQESTQLHWAREHLAWSHNNNSLQNSSGLFYRVIQVVY